MGRFEKVEASGANARVFSFDIWCHLDEITQETETQLDGAIDTSANLFRQLQGRWW